MRALRKRRHIGLISRWLGVIATLLPLLLPAVPGEAGTIVSHATVSADIFTAELCSLTRASHDQGGQFPADHHDEHCPLCVSIQQLGSCLAAEPQLELAPLNFVVDRTSYGSVFTYVADFHSPGQPRAPPVRV
jgi:hypothetical protein